MIKCLPVYILRHVATINSQLNCLSHGVCLVSGRASVVSSVFVGDTTDDQHASSGTNRSRHNAQVWGDLTAVEEPRYRQWLISLGHNTRHLGEPTLVQYVSSEGERKQFWGL